MCAWSPDGRFGAGASDGDEPVTGAGDVVLVERVGEAIRRIDVPVRRRRLVAFRT